MRIKKYMITIWKTKKKHITHNKDIFYNLIKELTDNCIAFMVDSYFVNMETNEITKPNLEVEI